MNSSMLTMAEEAVVGEAAEAEVGATIEGAAVVVEGAAKMKETLMKHLMSPMQTKLQKILPPRNNFR